MSLIDALLLDPAPFEVWVALRSDGAKGSGTQSDPYDGSTIPYPDLSITNLTRSGTQVTAVTAAEHGFLDGDWVTISGVSTTSNPYDAYYMGTFQVHPDPSDPENRTRFIYTIESQGTSSQASGTILCNYERERFDGVMRSLPENRTVRLGPGVFETKGSNGLVLDWKPKSGQKIVGAGIGVTTLKLVRAEVPETNYFAIFAWDWVHDFEVAEFTIDCNIAGQPQQYVTCGAVYAPGQRIRIRRIRAINFGAQTRGYLENFVIMSGSGGADLEEERKVGADCVIEDCIAEWPTANPTCNSTVFMLGAGENATDGFIGFHQGCAIRNCVVNGQIGYGPIVPIETINYDPVTDTVTIITKAPHGRTASDNVQVQGVTVGGNLNNLFNGVFAISEIVSSIELKYDHLDTTDTPDEHNGSVGGGVSSMRVSIEKIELVSGRTFRLTTRAPHYRTTNNNVAVSGVRKLNLDPSAAFNGVFAVDAYDPSKPKELKYTLLQDPDAPVGSLNLAWAAVNVGHIALSADNGAAAVVEGNRVFHCRVGGPYHDTWPTTDLLVRNNYYHDVVFGPFQTLEKVSTGPAILLASLDHVGTTAKAQTSFAHGFAVNDRVTISRAALALYNGLVTITAVPAADKFEYLMADSPSGPAANAAFSTYEEIPPKVTSQRRLESIFYSYRDGKHIASAKTIYSNHGFVVGDAVRITKAGHFDKVQYPDSVLFNGNIRITAVPDDRTFDYELPGDPGTDSEDPDFAAGYFGRIWQTKRWVVENNVIELSVTSFPSDSDDWHGLGIAMYGNNRFPPAFSFPEAVIRGNVIRTANDVPALRNRAVLLGGCEHPIIENNIVGVDRTDPLKHAACGETHTFNNLTPAGTLVTALSLDSPPRPAAEVATTVRAALDDALVSWFLGL